MSQKFDEIPDFKAYNNYVTVLEPTVNASVSEPYELRAGALYTLVATKMTNGTIAIEVFDTTTKEWQAAYQKGSPMELKPDREIVTLSEGSMIIRFNKSVTAVPVGLSINFA